MYWTGLCLLLAANGLQAETKILPDLDGRIDTGSGVLIGGQPEPYELVQAEQAGIRHVVNLRGEDEFTAWDQGQLVEQLGLRYHRIPIAGGQDLDRDAVETFDRVLAEVGDEPALLHCASGNRVGALYALRAAWIQGKDDEESLRIGRAHGLTGLEETVRERLEQGPGTDNN